MASMIIRIFHLGLDITFKFEIPCETKERDVMSMFPTMFQTISEPDAYISIEKGNSPFCKWVLIQTL